MRTLLLPLVSLVVSLTACNMQPSSDKVVAEKLDQAPAEKPGEKPGEKAAAHVHGEHTGPSVQGVKFGVPVTAAVVPLIELAKNPAAFKGKTVATTGTVASVCQERGCWMEIKDGTADVNVRMHAHAFFVPKDSRGKKAKVEGQVMLVKDGKECDEMNATGATVEFDATGVSFEPS